MPSVGSLAEVSRFRHCSIAAPGGAAPTAGADKVFQCSECKKTFRLAAALNHHIKTKHGGNAQAITVGPDGKPIADEAPAATPAATSSTGSAAAAAAGPAGAPEAPKGTGKTVVTDATDKPAPPVEEDPNKKGFECTICGKAFRLKAALEHHYQAKHNMKMPGTEGDSTAAVSESGGTMTTTDATTTTTSATGATTTVTDSLPAGFQYVQAGQPIDPQPPQYHLEVAPNAPEESEIAAHAHCVNQITLVGVVADVSHGYVFEDPAIQFTIATDFDNPPAGEPNKDFHTIRILGDETCSRVKEFIKDGNTVLVNGRLRMVPQFEPLTNKYYHFPVVHLHDGACHVALLDTPAAQPEGEKSPSEEQQAGGAEASQSA